MFPWARCPTWSTMVPKNNGLPISFTCWARWYFSAHLATRWCVQKGENEIWRVGVRSRLAPWLLCACFVALSPVRSHQLVCGPRLSGPSGAGSHCCAIHVRGPAHCRAVSGRVDPPGQQCHRRDCLCVQNGSGLVEQFQHGEHRGGRVAGTVSLAVVWSPVRFQGPASPL